MPTEHPRPFSTQLAALVAIAIMPALLLQATGALWLAWLGLGALSWVAALVVKTFVFGPVYYFSNVFEEGTVLSSGVWGLCSAIAEIGTTVYVLYHAFAHELSLVHAVNFGAGVATVEVLCLIGVALFGKKDPETSDPTKYSRFVNWSGVIERLYTVPGHIFSRVIVWYAFTSESYALMALPLLLFAATDGFATYAVDQKWDLLNDRTSKRFHAALAAIVVVEGLVVMAACL